MHIFKDQVAVITGGASGIGKAFAYQFGTEGMKVVIADIEENSLNNAVNELQSHDIDVIGIITDVSNQKDVANLYKKTMNHFGKVHILCNNAGVAGDLDFVGQRNKPLWEQSSSLWDWTFGVNVSGVLNGIKEFLPSMLKQNEPGHIVNTASMAGLLGGSTSGIYGATKHAVVRISEALFFQLEEIDSPIKASVLCPGIINTRIFSSGRNRPDSMWENSEKPTLKMIDEQIKQGDKHFNHGLPPEIVAKQVMQAIQDEQFWILTEDVPLNRIKNRTEHIIGMQNPILSKKNPSESYSNPPIMEDN
ncbi:MAG: SDR family NAD(P)-dependent oxidoreductase [Dehalococcoidia bacterium]